MPRKSESVDTDLATLVKDETSALHDAVTDVIATETGGGA